jgi:ribosomal protein S18 acetylase RimI-like enzyme
VRQAVFGRDLVTYAPAVEALVSVAPDKAERIGNRVLFDFGGGARTYFGRTTELVQIARPTLHAEAPVAYLVRWLFVIVGGVILVIVALAVAREGERIVGTVQIDLDTPPNQQHRTEVTKLLVHPGARRRGIARALMVALEDVARSEGRTLLTLDTWTGEPAERLYQSLGYITVGVIPRYARGSLSPELEPATFMYKELAPVDRQADSRLLAHHSAPRI